MQKIEKDVPLSVGETIDYFEKTFKIRQHLVKLFCQMDELYDELKNYPSDLSLAEVDIDLSTDFVKYVNKVKNNLPTFRSQFNDLNTEYRLSENLKLLYSISVAEFYESNRIPTLKIKEAKDYLTEFKKHMLSEMEELRENKNEVPAEPVQDLFVEIDKLITNLSDIDDTRCVDDIDASLSSYFMNLDYLYPQGLASRHGEIDELEAVRSMERSLSAKQKMIESSRIMNALIEDKSIGNPTPKYKILSNCFFNHPDLFELSRSGQIDNVEKLLFTVANYKEEIQTINQKIEMENLINRFNNLTISEATDAPNIPNNYSVEATYSPNVPIANRPLTSQPTYAEENLLYYDNNLYSNCFSNSDTSSLRKM